MYFSALSRFRFTWARSFVELNSLILRIIWKPTRDSAELNYIDNKQYYGVANIGYKPTFNGKGIGIQSIDNNNSCQRISRAFLISSYLLTLTKPCVMQIFFN